MLYYMKNWTGFALVASWLSVASTAAISNTCKATPGSSSWPSTAEWNALNQTIEGRLLKPPPPCAVCHSSQPSFNEAICKSTDWTSATTYANNPLGIINPNWSNDSCLPEPQYPCSGEGFPVYVVNATSAQDVAAGINFARKYNIRVNVKGSGHDYLGRSVASNALSIWTKNIRGIAFHDSFQPKGCSSCSGIPALTLGAGQDWGEIYPAVNAKGLVVVGGTGDTIGLGGYLTGGGHSPLSAKLGLAVDQVLEMEVVTASGEILVTNEVQNSDLFWAMRGGGGATFGIMTSVTIKTFPSMPIATAAVTLGALPNSEAFWNATTFIVSQSPRLQASGIMGYCYLSSSYKINGTAYSFYTGVLLMPNGTIADFNSAAAFLKDYLSSIDGIQLSYETTLYPNLYEWYKVHKNTIPIGSNSAVGNRLLDAKALSDVAALRKAIEGATPAGTLANLNLVAGPGLWKATPAGGSDSVTPAWRKSYVEYAVPVSWPFLDNAAGKTQANLLTNVYMAALRKLAPDTGSYLNEGDVNEPDFQEAYWGSNYPRLLSIKKKFDPSDVFWCAVCVGNENWKVEGTKLCRV